MPEMKEVTFSGVKSEGKRYTIRVSLDFSKSETLLNGVPCRLLMAVDKDGKTGLWFIDEHLKKGNASLIPYAEKRNQGKSFSEKVKNTSKDKAEGGDS
jgi:hypothetical protein